MKIARKIREFIKDIKYSTNTGELNIDNIKPMRYPEGQEDKRKNFVNPFEKYNSRHSRIRYRR